MALQMEEKEADSYCLFIYVPVLAVKRRILMWLIWFVVAETETLARREASS